MMTKRIQLFCTVVIVMLAAASLAQASTDCDFSYSNYARAVQLHDMGDYAAALRHYDCALAEDPDDAVIPRLIANVYDDIAHASRAWSPAAPLTTAEILGLPPVSTWAMRAAPSQVPDFPPLVVEPAVGSKTWHGNAVARVRGGTALRLVIVWGQGNSMQAPAEQGASTASAVAANAGASRAIQQARNFVRNLDWTRARIRFEQALEMDTSQDDIRRELEQVYHELSQKRGLLILY